VDAPIDSRIGNLLSLLAVKVSVSFAMPLIAILHRMVSVAAHRAMLTAPIPARIVVPTLSPVVG
jgi:hypothetical protein